MKHLTSTLKCVVRAPPATAAAGCATERPRASKRSRRVNQDCVDEEVQLGERPAAAPTRGPGERQPRLKVGSMRVCARRIATSLPR